MRAHADTVLIELTTGSDVAVLDVGLSDPGGGMEVCRKSRDTGHTVPVLMLMLMLIDRTASIDPVVGQDSGADDCLAKPFRLAELFACIRALVPRARSRRPLDGQHRVTDQPREAGAVVAARTCRDDQAQAPTPHRPPPSGRAVVRRRGDRTE